MKLMRDGFDSIQGGIRDLYFRHHDKHLTQAFSFIDSNKITFIPVFQIRKQRLREVNTLLAVKKQATGF